MDLLARSPLSAAELRRLPAVSRGALLDLHRVPGVVLVDVLDHGGPDAWVPAGSVVALVYVAPGPDGLEPVAREVQRTVAAAAPAGLVVVPVVREAGAWERARAWYRWRRWQVRRWLWERQAGGAR